MNAFKGTTDNSNGYTVMRNLNGGTMRGYINKDGTGLFAYMLLEAYELGLGTCWIGAFKEDEVKSLLGVPNHVRVVALSPLGYPAVEVSARTRKRLDEIICFEAYR